MATCTPLIAVTKNLTRKKFKKGKDHLNLKFKGRPFMTGSHDDWFWGRSQIAPVPRSRELGMLMFSSLFFIHFGNLACGMVPSTFRVELPISVNFIQKSSSQTCTDMCLQDASRPWQVDNINHTHAFYIFVGHAYFVMWKMHMYIFCLSPSKITLTHLLVFFIHLSSNLLINVQIYVTNTFFQNAAYLFNGTLGLLGKKKVLNEC